MNIRVDVYKNYLVYKERVHSCSINFYCHCKHEKKLDNEIEVHIIFNPSLMNYLLHFGAASFTVLFVLKTTVKQITSTGNSTIVFIPCIVFKIFFIPYPKKGLT